MLTTRSFMSADGLANRSTTERIGKVPTKCPGRLMSLLSLEKPIDVERMAA
jgi:hypothetical protein